VKRKNLKPTPPDRLTKRGMRVSRSEQEQETRCEDRRVAETSRGGKKTLGDASRGKGGLGIALEKNPKCPQATKPVTKTQTIMERERKRKKLGEKGEEKKVPS